MSIMDDNNNLLPGVDNIRTLTYFLGLLIDNRLVDMRRNTPYANVRPSDIRVFIAASRKPISISEIARLLHISRQAAQTSVQRLQELGVIELREASDNRRDKRVEITPRGRMAGITAANQIAQVEQEFADVIGPSQWADLKTNLKALTQHYANVSTSAATSK